MRKKHLFVVIALLLLTAFFLRIIFTNYNLYLIEDAYTYLLKSIEIINGNFTPVLSHAMGLSFFVAPFLYFFGNGNLLQYMHLANTLNALIGALIVIPTFLISREFVREKTAILTSLFIVFCPTLVYSSTKFYTEPLFTLFFLFSLYFIIIHQKNKFYITYSLIFASLAFFVRPTGLIILPIIIASYLAIQNQYVIGNVMMLIKSLQIKNKKYFIMAIKNPEIKKQIIKIIYITIIFFALSAPFLIQRTLSFGHPLNFGENNKYFIDTYDKVWATNIEIPTIGEYLLTHNIFDYFNKFVLNGFIQILKSLVVIIRSWFFFSPITYLIMLINVFLGFLMFRKDIRVIVLNFSVIFFIIFLSLVFDIFSTERHLYPLVPILIIFSFMSIEKIILSYKKIIKNQDVLLLIFTLIICIMSLITLANPTYHSEPLWKNTVGDIIFITPVFPYNTNSLNKKFEFPVWSEWVVKNLKGRISVTDGDYIMLQLPDSKTSGVNQTERYAPESNISVIRHPYFEKINPALNWYKQNEVNYIVHLSGEENKNPFLAELDGSEKENILKLVYSKEKVNIYKIQ